MWNTLAWPLLILPACSLVMPPIYFSPYLSQQNNKVYPTKCIPRHDISCLPLIVSLAYPSMYFIPIPFIQYNANASRHLVPIPWDTLCLSLSRLSCLQYRSFMISPDDVCMMWKTSTHERVIQYPQPNPENHRLLYVDELTKMAHTILEINLVYICTSY